MASRVREIHDALVSKKTHAPEMKATIAEEVSEEDFVLLQKIASGKKLGALAGIPVALKDNICVKGTRTTAASKILEDYTAAYDAHVVEKLRLASAVIVGKTNLDEFAMGGSTENSAFGPTKNPHDSSRVAGGSSGGSAAAVASGMAPVALGSDTGGSIRQPASFCGVVGFKPSYGRVSRSGLIAMASSLDQIGTFASSVEDAEILFRAIEGKDPMDMTSVETHESVSDKKEYVIGVPEAFLASGPDARVLDLMQKSFKKAESQSASWRIKFEKIDLPSAPYALACYYIIMPAEVSSNLARFDGMRYAHRAKADTLFGAYERTREEGFGSEVKRRIAIGTYVLSHGYYDAYYLQAQRVRTLIVSDFTRAFEKVDAVVFPTTPSHAFKIGEKSSDPLAMYLEDIYTIQANLAGLPAISIPLGKVENLPVGIQFIGKRFGDYALLNFAKRFEAALA
ncbi:MAG: Glutamyl-tRNA(Gln) amidotransferase subunit A [Candidatus Giovannonibacteria bacterium GW2011_GWB1_47_6b]|uniref:Glutamyl-tRNA(Gln) amidotransferase subunit A n=1 Tax=Candidatus Giovannonibacteria bacterium GW2011_GWB1_47_6b TaxID=1618655 RepID=A0A0G1VBT1_9BACT|nr:MAG: Glutamyl-tRNA(Gln) amidotransferase subunit A [Candidatus Giovannonibacteria bacterium GW2011_GWB1_47_6b]